MGQPEWEPTMGRSPVGGVRTMLARAIRLTENLALLSLLTASSVAMQLAALREKRRCRDEKPVRAGSPAPAETISFPSGALTLRGVLYRPPGPGPFPAVLYNHGSA